MDIKKTLKVSSVLLLSLALLGGCGSKKSSSAADTGTTSKSEAKSTKKTISWMSMLH